MQNEAPVELSRDDLSAKIINAPALRGARKRLRPPGLLLLNSVLAFLLVNSIANSKDVTLPDIFRKESIGAVLLDPAGRRVVFERIPSNYEAVHFGGGELSGQNGAPRELYIYEIGSGNSPSRLFGTEQGIEGERAISFSPNGTRVAIQWMQEDKFRTGVYSFESRQLIELNITAAAAISPMPCRNLVWISEDEIVLSSVSDDEPPLGVLAGRSSAGRKLYHAWEDTWSGRHPTADVISSHAGYPDLPRRSGNLIRANVKTGELRIIAEGVYFALSLSPDHRHLAAARQGGIQQPDPARPFSYEGFRVLDHRRYEAVLIDPDGTTPPRQLAVDSQLRLSNSTWGWSVDSNRLSFFVARGDTRWDEGNFVLYDLRTRRGKAVHLPGESPSPLDPSGRDYDPAIPFGVGLAVPVAHSDTVGGEIRVDWFETRLDGSARNLTANLRDVSPKWVVASLNSLFILADGKIWSIPLKGPPHNIKVSNSAVAVPAPNSLSTLNLQRNDSSDDLTEIVAQILDSNDLALINLTNETTRILEVPDGHGIAVSASAKLGLAILLKVNEPDTTMDAVRIKEPSKQILQLNKHLTLVSPHRSVAIQYKLADGTEVVSHAILPDDWQPGRRVPVILDVYPTVNAPARLNDFGADPADLFATIGYAVLYPFSSIEKLKNGDDTVGNWGELANRSADAFVLAGYGDPERMGVWGGSWGGSAALAIVEQSHRFRAAVAHSAVSVDLVSAYADLVGWNVSRAFPYDYFPSGTGDNEGPYGPFSLGGPPWESLPKAIASSLLFKVDAIQTPVMLVYSDSDAFSMGQGDEMFGALFRMRKEAQYVRYWGEDHFVKSPANIRDYWSRNFAWFDKWFDVSRDSGGRLIYGEHSAKQRLGIPSWSPTHFLDLERIFGPEIRAFK